MIEEIKRALPTARRLPDERLAELVEAARRKVRTPKPQREKFDAEGYYDAVIIGGPVQELVAVVEEGTEDPVRCALVGQRVRKLDGPFRPPFTVTYVSVAEHERYQADVLMQVRKALE